LTAQGINTELYMMIKKKDEKDFYPILPTSAATGEGIPDLMYQITLLAQTKLSQRISVKNNFDVSD
jgi:translation initiation factor IF-2